MKRKLGAALACAVGLSISAAPWAFAGKKPHAQNEGDIDHVLLISIDGMHAVDLINCIAGHYCLNLASLASTGVN